MTKLLKNDANIKRISPVMLPFLSLLTVVSVFARGEIFVGTLFLLAEILLVAKAIILIGKTRPSDNRLTADDGDYDWKAASKIAKKFILDLKSKNINDHKSKKSIILFSRSLSDCVRFPFWTRKQIFRFV
jgi:hypothetical protein